MRLYLSKALLWLVFLALPLQGIAAGQMVLCGAASDSARGSSSQVLTTSSQALSNADTMFASADESALMECCDQVHMSTTHCAVSLACGAALASAAAPFGMGPRPERTAPKSQPGLADAGFFTDAPERPPRLLSA